MDYLISLVLVLPYARALVPSWQGVGRLIQFNGPSYPLYGSASSGEEYEPYAVAALPLHPPMPVLHVLTPSAGYGGRPQQPAGLTARQTARRPARRPAQRPARRPRPDTDVYAYDPPQTEETFDPDGYEYTSSEEYQYPSSRNTIVRDQYDDEVVMYARPNRHGGFTYRRAQPARRITVLTQTAPPAPPAPSAPPTPSAPPAPSAPSLPPMPPMPPMPPATPAPPAPSSTTLAPPIQPQQPVIIRIHKYRVIH